MKALFKTHPILVLAFLLALGLSLFFAGNIVYRTIYWSNHQNVAVQPWMTVGYIARSWNLEGPEIDARAGLPKPEGHPLTLLEIATQRQVPVADVIDLVEKTIADLTAEHQAARDAEGKP